MTEQTEVTQKGPAKISPGLFVLVVPQIFGDSE